VSEKSASSMNFLFNCLKSSRYKKYKRVAFADALKEEIMERYHIPTEPIIPEEKNKIQFRDENGKNVSFRDLCIHWALFRRQEDPDYWAKKALDACGVTEGAYSVIGETAGTVFTDWRFLNEYHVVKEKYPNVITARIFRPGVEIPDELIKSEHELDHFVTDILIVPAGDESAITEAVKLFPAYANFTLLKQSIRK